MHLLHVAWCQFLRDQRTVIVKPRYGLGRQILPLRYLWILQLEQSSDGVKGSPGNAGIFHLTSNLPSSLYFLDSNVFSSLLWDWSGLAVYLYLWGTWFTSFIPFSSLDGLLKILVTNQAQPGTDVLPQSGGDDTIVPTIYFFKGCCIPWNHRLN